MSMGIVIMFVGPCLLQSLTITMQLSQLPQCIPSPSRMATVRPITNSASLNDFQRFLLQQIQQLQQSSLCQRSTSNVVAVQDNNYGVLKESIINYYCQERAARRNKETEQIAIEVSQLRFAHEFMANRIHESLQQFYGQLRTEVEGVSREMQRLEGENAHLKGKLKEMSKVNRQLHQENKELKRDLQEWEQAKQRRKLKKQQRDEPSIERIQEIIQKKLLREETPSHMTPLKQFSMDHFLNRRVPSFHFATSNAENKTISHTDKKFRTSSISDSKNIHQFSRFEQAENGQRDGHPQRRKSKQKLRVVSIDP